MPLACAAAESCWRSAARNQSSCAAGLRPRFKRLAQLFAFEQFGDDIGRAFVLADIVDGEDVRVIERRGGAGFLLEAAQTVGITGELGGQHLDRDLATESRVFCQIDLAHSAGAELRDNLIMIEACARGNDHIYPFQSSPRLIGNRLISQHPKL